MTDRSSDPKQQREILSRILLALRSEDATRQLQAIRELGTVDVSNVAIVWELEKLVLREDKEIRDAALAALDLKTSQYVSSRLSTMGKTNRQLILAELDRWQKDGLVEPHHAQVLRRRYDYDIRPGTPIKAAIKAQQAPQPKIQPEASQATQPRVESARPAAPPPPAQPRPSLTQALLSETSIRIYLFLGAFFVVAAAAILAALVQAARLPILLAATVAFAAGAVVLKKRLPQPSFALAIVFSFLLLIDANVLAETLNLRGQGVDLYWSAVFLLMASIWFLGTWFYESRVFSLVAFLSLSLGMLRFAEIFDASTAWRILAIAVASLLGLFGVGLLKDWKGREFAQPLFLLIQAQQGILLFASSVFVTISMFDASAAPGDWIASAFTWLLAASFYALSADLVRFVLFPWAAAASLFPLPWLLLSAFDAPATTMISGFVVWGVLTGFASEFAHRTGRPAMTQYYYPLLGLSLPLFLTAILWGFIDGVSYGFAASLGAAITYTVIHLLRPRWYVWLTALLAGLGAYFSFFSLPLMARADVYFGFQVLGASLLLLVPELFSRGPLSFPRTWRWPPVAVGTLLTALSVLILLTLPETAPGQLGKAAIILSVYALLFAGYALRFQEPVIGYLGTASAAVSVVYALNYLKVDRWLPALTALAAVYYCSGFVLGRRAQNKAWGAMLVNSGLALGVIVSLVAVFPLKATGGWYALVIAALFAVEMFTRRIRYLELFVESLLSVALIMLLHDFKVQDLAYYFFGLSLIWFAADLGFKLTYKDMRVPRIAWIAGGALASAATFSFVTGETAAGAIAVCYGVYTVLFAAYAFIYRQPRLGYLSTASTTVMVLFALDHFHIETWLPIFTGLAVIYYVLGFLLRKQSATWAETFRYSGLALGSIVSIVALTNAEATGGWYAALIGGLFILETMTGGNGWFEAGVYVLFSIAAFLILHDFKLDKTPYILLALSLVWLVGDMVFERTLKDRKMFLPARLIGNGLAAWNALALLTAGSAIEAAICFSAYAPFYAVYAWFYKKPMIGYASTASLGLAVFFGLHAAGWEQSLLPLTAVAVVYYSAGFFLRRTNRAPGWDLVLLFSGLGLGTLVALATPFLDGGLEKAIPIAVAATFYAAEAFARRNVWLGFPANALYLMAYFTILFGLNVDQPQFFSVGAAALGLLMHYLLTRSGSRRGAFITGMVSQLILLGTTYIQMISAGEVGYFFVLFFQALVVLAYGVVARSRSLVVAPIAFAVLAVVTVLYSALKNLSLVVIIGVTGITLLILGIVAVVMRERITTLAERFSDWDA